MNHIKAILLKFVMIAVILYIILTLIYDVAIENTLVISAVLTLVAYVLGDLMVFRKKNVNDNDNHNHDHRDQGKRNMMATVSDIVLSFFVIWLMGEYLLKTTPDIIQASVISAIAIGVGEWFYHKYLDNKVFPKDHHHPNNDSVNHSSSI